MAKSRAPSFDLLEEYGGHHDSVAVSPHWAICVVRLGLPLSYSRKEGKSVTTDVSQGAHLRGPNLIITSDCTSLMVTGSKDSHTKSMTAELKQTDHNYLVEVLPGDWVLAWMVHNEEELVDLIERIKKADPQEPCNRFDDGLKFVGRVDSVRKRMHLDRSSGMKTVSVTVSAIGFKELDTQFFYDHNLAENDTRNIGGWLAKVGLEWEKIFSVDIKDGQKNNSRKLIAAFIDLLVGKGVKSRQVNQAERTTKKKKLQQHGSLRAGTGGGTTDSGEAPFAYIVPRVVGALLGKTAEDQSKNGGIMSYADILDTLMGIQEYASTESNPDKPGDAFIPKLDDRTSPRMFTGNELLGTFLPVMPDFTNKPLWSVLQQFLNPTVNEMYTCMRVNPQGLVVPTLVVRQIPFTTDAFDTKSKVKIPLAPGPDLKVTRFLDLPRWKIHPVMINDVDIGRSDATRINFVHVYGQDANLAEQVTFSQQLVTNPPARDDLDIMRSGLRTYMTTVACAIKDSVGHTPKNWIDLVADRLIGSHLTLNGTIQSIGIKAPICEGDNIEWEHVVYHIESLTHHCMIGANGERSWNTMLTLTNGLRSDGISDTDKEFPIYPGLKADDNRVFDPGVNVDDKFDRSEAPTKDGDLVTPQPPGGQPDSSEEMPPFSPIAGLDPIKGL